MKMRGILSAQATSEQTPERRPPLGLGGHDVKIGTRDVQSAENPRIGWARSEKTRVRQFPS